MTKPYIEINVKSIGGNDWSALAKILNEAHFKGQLSGNPFLEERSFFLP